MTTYSGIFKGSGHVTAGGFSFAVKISDVVTASLTINNNGGSFSGSLQQDISGSAKAFGHTISFGPENVTNSVSGNTNQAFAVDFDLAGVLDVNFGGSASFAAKDKKITGSGSASFGGTVDGFGVSGSVTVKGTLKESAGGANLGLLRNYMASTFATPGDGHDFGAPIAEQASSGHLLSVLHH